MRQSQGLRAKQPNPNKPKPKNNRVLKTTGYLKKHQPTKKQPTKPTKHKQTSPLLPKELLHCTKNTNQQTTKPKTKN